MFIVMSFFEQSCKEPIAVKVAMPTFLILPEKQEDGTVILSHKCLELENNPNDGLHFDDFSLSTLIAHGINPKSLNIQSDTRLGITDAMIEDFNQRCDSIVNELFDVKS